MKRIGCVLLSLFLCQGCISAGNLVSFKNLDQITAGMTEAKVKKIIGPEDQRYDFDKGRFVLYYRNSKPVIGKADLAQHYTAVSFEEGRVITIGQDLKDIWETSEGGNNNGLLSSISEEECKARIKALEEKVRPIPVSDAKQNLELYRALLALDPKNTRYKRKVAFYRQRIKLQAESTEENTSKPLPPATKKASVKSKKPITPLSPEDTETQSIQIEAVKLKAGVYFVWIKNLTSQKITIGRDTFAILDVEKRTVQFDLSPELIDEVAPNTTASGELRCLDDTIPFMLVFTHANTEPIVKMLN